MYSRNLIILTLSQIFAFTAAPITVFLSGIIGSQLISYKSLATLPTSLSIVGMAVSSIVASIIMKNYGRKFGFMSGSLVSTLAALLGAFAISIDSFFLYCLTCFFIGYGIAVGAQYRFAAAESVTKDKIPYAVSIILVAGIFSAILGPSIANWTKNIIDFRLYVGSYLSLSILTIIPFFILMFYKNEIQNIDSIFNNTRSYFKIIKEPKIILAILAAITSYSVMTFIMTATPISMHIIDKINLDKTSIVIQWHVISMFLPSLFTGHLIKIFGHSKIMILGIILFVISISINLFEQTFIFYLISLIFLGIAWNFLNISGTSLLVISYRKEEKFKVQGFNDFLVFSFQAIFSFLAGYTINNLNWFIMNLLCFPIIIFMFVVVIYLKNK